MINYDYHGKVNIFNNNRRTSTIKLTLLVCFETHNILRNYAYDCGDNDNNFISVVFLLKKCAKYGDKELNFKSLTKIKKIKKRS